MADLSTYTRAKDWIIVALVGLVFTLLGIVATDNRRRIEVLENRQSAIESYSARIARLEEALQSQRQELGRRLERMEDKLDKISSRYERGVS